MSRAAFRVPFFLFLCILGLLCGFIVWKAATVSLKDKNKLDKIIASQPKKRRKDQLQSTKELITQVRWGVLKRLWMVDGPCRRVLQLAGSRSETSLYTKKTEMQLLETFYDVEGIVQQELFYKLPDGQELSMLEAMGREELLLPMQRFRYFEAQRAVHDPQSSTVIAYDVKFWTFQVEGHDIVENPLRLEPEAVGQASAMTVFSKENQGKFYAEDFKLQIMTEQGLW